MQILFEKVDITEGQQRTLEQYQQKIISHFWIGRCNLMTMSFLPKLIWKGKAIHMGKNTTGLGE